MFLNLLTLSVPDVTPGCFSIFWLWAYLMLLQDVFQYFDFERTWRYSRMFFNLLTLSVPDITPGCFSFFWLWEYLTLLHDVFKSFDFERTWRYSRMFFNLLTGPGQFSLCNPPWRLRIYRNMVCFCSIHCNKESQILDQVSIIWNTEVIWYILRNICLASSNHMLTCMKNCIQWI
jgi:hypothetical protein